MVSGVGLGDGGREGQSGLEQHWAQAVVMEGARQTAGGQARNWLHKYLMEKDILQPPVQH